MDGATQLENTIPPPPGGRRDQAFWIVAYAVMALVASWLVVSLYGIVIEIIIALILAAGLRPLVGWLAARRIPRGLAIVLVLLGVVLIFAGFMAIIVPQVASAVQALIAGAPQIGHALVTSYDRLRAGLPFLPPADKQIQSLVDQVGSQIGGITGSVLGGIVSVTSSVVGGLVSFIFVITMIIIFLSDGSRVEGFLLSLFPARRRPRTKALLDRIGVRTGGWLVGQVGLMIAMGFGAFIILSLLHVQGAAVLALITALFELIPAIGPMLAVIPAVLVAFAQSPLLALAVLVAFFLMHQAESAFLVPTLMGRSVQLHPLAVLVSVIALTSLFGVLGAVIAPTIAVVIDELLGEWRVRMDAAVAPGAASGSFPNVAEVSALTPGPSPTGDG